MNTEVTKEQIDEVLQQCQENINNDDAEYFRSYEEGIKDVIEWLFYDGEKPSIATDY